MNAILFFLSGDAWRHLAMALLHTLWQGLFFAALLMIILRRLRANRPEARYWATFSALMAIVLCGLVTWSVLDLDRSKHVAPSGKQSAVKERMIPLGDREFGTNPGRQPTVDRVPGETKIRSYDSICEKWLSAIIVGWLTGVAFMSVRMAWMVARLRRFVRGPEVVDKRMRSLIEELQRLLHLTRPLKIVDTADGFGPAVLGILQPILAVPVCVMTGLPADALRDFCPRIGPHPPIRLSVQSNANGRRGGFVFQSGRVVDQPANPHRARGQLRRPGRKNSGATFGLCPGIGPLGRARATIPAPIAAPAWTGRQRPRLLLDRIQRMLLPGYRPQLPISPFGFTAFLLVGILVLCGLWRGTSAAVELAAKILTPAERIEQVSKAQSEFAPPDSGPVEGNITLSGTVKTFDGKPLPKRIWGYTYTRSGNGSYNSSISIKPPEFSEKVRLGTSYIYMESDGYAPAFAGPFTGKAGETISDIKLILERGFPLAVRAIDEKDNPIAGVEIKGYPLIDGSGMGRGDIKYVTDENGDAVIPNTIEWLYRFSARKPGFQPYSSEMKIKPNQPLTLTLSHSQPISGVVASTDGQPAAGAEIKVFFASMGMGGQSYGVSGPKLAVTDADGRFELNELEDDAVYTLLVLTKEKNKYLICDVSTKNKDLPIKLGPAITISGRIHGDLDMLEKQDGKPVVKYGQTVAYAANSETSFSGTPVPVEPVDGGGIFTLSGLLPGKVSITAGKHVVNTTIGPDKLREEVAFDLTQPPSLPTKRQVILRFKTPDDNIQPKGSIWINACADDCVPSDFIDKFFPLEKGEVKIEAYAPGHLYYQPKGLLGYWFQEASIRIDPGTEPIALDVPVLPAGAITGQVLKSDGSPATDNIYVGVQGVLQHENTTTSGGFGADNIKVSADGKFFITPLPLNGSFTVCASSGYNLQLSEPITLDDAKPMANITLRLPRTTGAEGVVLDPEGKPAASLPFEIGFSDPLRNYNRGWSGGLGFNTDKQGRFYIDGLSVDVGQYSLEFNPRRDYRPLSVSLPRDGKPISVQLLRGYVIEGQVLEDKTGWPVPGVELYALASDLSTDHPIREAEKLTDSRGRFRFSNLENQTYRINIRNGPVLESRFNPEWKPGDGFITFRVSLPEGGKLKPRQPDAE